MTTGKTCFTCSTPVDAYSAYCDGCIAAQIAEHGSDEDERRAFDAFHRFADKQKGSS